MEIKIEREAHPWGRGYRVQKESGSLLFPSVTTVLKLITEPKFKALREKLGEKKWQKILDDASYRGTVMHAMLEHFLLDYAKGLPIETCLTTAQDVARNIDLNEPQNTKLVKKGRDLFWNFYHEKFWEGIKRVLYNELFLWTDFKGGWAGATDFIFEDYSGEHVVIDFKSSTSMKDENDILSYKCQISAYMFAYAERYGVIPSRGEIWISNEENSDIQRFIVYRSEFKEYLREFLKLLKEFREINKLD